MDVAGFREAFPSFTLALHPDVRVAFWLRAAALRLPPDRWGDMFDDAVALFVAHNLTMEAETTKATDGTGGAQAARGPLASESKTIGPVATSKAYAGTATAQPGAGHWNATIYGQQLYELIKLIGVGGLQV